MYLCLHVCILSAYCTVCPSSSRPAACVCPPAPAGILSGLLGGPLFADSPTVDSDWPGARPSSGQEPPVNSPIGRPFPDTAAPSQLALPSPNELLIGNLLAE